MTIRRAAVLCLLAFALAYAGGAAAEDIQAAYAAPEPGAPLTLEGDMGLLIGETWYPILNDFAPLRAALGEPDEISAAPSCVFQGEDREFVYGGMSVFTNPLGELDVWYEAYIVDEGFVTARGVGVGADLDALLAAYGENCYMEGENVLTYSVSGVEGDYESPCIIFELTDGVVSCIDIYYPTNTM